MGDDLKASLEALIKNVALMQKSIEANAKAIADLSLVGSSASGGRQGSGGEHHQDRPPKHWRPEFPRYDDKNDPLVFLNQCESFFRQQRIMAEERTWMASYNLQEGAQLWYMQVQEDEGTPPWPRFKDLLNLRFGPPLRSAPLFELASCRRTGTVEEYQDRFQALLPRASHLDEAQRVQLFTGGLLPLAQPPRLEPESAIARVGHEPRAPDGACGAVLRLRAQGTCLWCAADARAVSCPSAHGTDGAAHRHSRGPPGQAPEPS
jgi:hypothetical protein